MVANRDREARPRFDCRHRQACLLRGRPAQKERVSAVGESVCALRSPRASFQGESIGECSIHEQYEQTDDRWSCMNQKGTRRILALSESKNCASIPILHAS
ncbi:hypothetical protein SBBP2_700020 [Burkholderiales bacterium]|nr:hypothetical protein SBBP2_700020 [Burkholderiales bacterium]